MSRPIIRFELSDDENSVFVYDGNGQLDACIGMQREDAVLQLESYLRQAVQNHLQVVQVPSW